jgi:pSer/pThr/pTyr-binding forkhead associated (FHA) protein
VNTLSSDPPPSSIGGVEVEIEAADGAQRRVQLLGPVITIGRTRAAALVLKHPDVSRRHAEVEVMLTGVLLRDVSTNGTWIGGERVRGRRALPYGEHVVIGPFILRFSPLPPEAFSKDVSVDVWAPEQTTPTR